MDLPTKPKKRTTLIQARVDAKLHAAFHAECKRKGLSIREAIEHLMREAVAPKGTP